MDMRKLRERAGLRAVDVCFRLGVNESTVRNWEKGRTVPRFTLNQIDELLSMFNCTYEELRDAMKESMITEEDDIEGSE